MTTIQKTQQSALYTLRFKALSSSIYWHSYLFFSPTEGIAYKSNSTWLILESVRYNLSKRLGMIRSSLTFPWRFLPVDGYYEDWSAWGECSVTCGGGSQERNRTCVMPKYGGQDCQEAATESQACNGHNCPGRTRRRSESLLYACIILIISQITAVLYEYSPPFVESMIFADVRKFCLCCLKSRS